MSASTSDADAESSTSASNANANAELMQVEDKVANGRMKCLGMYRVTGDSSAARPITVNTKHLAYSNSAFILAALALTHLAVIVVRYHKLSIFTGSNTPC